jgi:DNA-binding PadR family transcriptional regulator
VEAALLLLLDQGGPAYGYALAAAAVEQGLVQPTVNLPRIYEALGRLEQAGAVEGAVVDGAGGPERREHRLTDEGRQRLGRWMTSLRLARGHLDAMLGAYYTGLTAPSLTTPD